MNNPLTGGNKGNVAIIYDFSTSKLEIGHTLNSATDSTIVMNTANTIPVNINGTLEVTGTTTSTTTTSGSLKVAGGVGVVENLNVGGVTKVWDGTDATTTTSGAVQVVGGLGVAKTLFAADVSSGSVIVSDGTTSTTTTTGSLKVAGGVGVVENLNVGGVTKVWDGTDATTTTSGAVQVVGGLGVAKTLFAADVSSGSVIVSDGTTSTTTTTGALQVAGGVGVVENLNVGGDLKVDTSVLVVNSTTNRVGINKAVPAYTLDVDGDINFTGTFREDGNPFISTPWTIETSPDALNYTDGNVGIGAADPAAKLHVTGNAHITTTLNVGGVVTLTDTTEATSSTTGALKAAGGVGIAKDVYVGERAYVTGGLITNTGGVTKKTYSFTGALTSGQTIADSTITITFSAHVFYAKVVAHLIESDDEVSTLSMECGGGHRTGGTPLVIAKGPVSVFGSASTNPWNIAVAATTTTVALAPTTNMAAAGNYNVFIEYISAHASGAVTKITEGSTDVITFGY